MDIWFLEKWVEILQDKNTKSSKFVLVATIEAKAFLKGTALIHLKNKKNNGQNILKI